MGDNSLPALLSTLTSALESATAPAEVTISSQGLSLLNTKNELFLSYLENLVFLILVKLQHYSQDINEAKVPLQSSEMHRSTVERLAELSLYLEKGVRPLENRLKYQVDKVVRAADEASLQAGDNQRHAAGKTPSSKVNERRLSGSSASSAGSGSSGSDQGYDSSEEANNLIFRPSTAALVSGQPFSRANEDQSSSAVYKPPKNHPTALPINTSEKQGRSRDKPLRSAAMDDFIANELDTAPVAEPSIGSTIRAGGRTTLTAHERQEQKEKQRYEEENFTRLPGMSKKEKRAKTTKKKESFGGEEWGGLNSSVDRISKMVGRKKNVANALERSRKRVTGDFGRDSDKRRKLDS